jgi:hypothetical protein
MKRSVSAELDEQRCLIEKQQREIDRQWHHIEMQRRHIYLMQSQLDTVQDALRTAVPILRAKHGDDKANDHAARPPKSGRTPQPAERHLLR